MKKARDALIVQGKYPSIDAVRAELGTGSKTTIHRYLKELEEEEGGGVGGGIAVSEALQDLVGRLSARLNDEADARIAETRAAWDIQRQQQASETEKLQQELAATKARLAESVQLLADERDAHAQSGQLLTAARMEGERLTQQVQDMAERLRDNEAHRQSLEEKHLHARTALEHYRESIKEQRDQDQRRHEQQVQQLQAELRASNQSLSAKQGEITKLYGELAKTTAELAAATKSLHQAESQLHRAETLTDELRRVISERDHAVATLTERADQAATAKQQLHEVLVQRDEQLRQLEIERAQLLVIRDGQDTLLAGLRAQLAELRHSKSES
ncbi:MAG: DNA-binding protein [Uliginosibacterium sp.]|nr:DNA-binding protein [Uliginosibacterium sp.]